MSDKLRSVMARLSDGARYERVPGVTIFDEHSEEYFVDGKGRPCREGDEGATKKVRNFGRAELEEIARRCNERDRTGSLSPLTFGHTVSGEDDEKRQPEGVGYATRYRVGYDADLGRHVIRADFYVRKERFGEASTYPRVSIELWPRQKVIDPIALLRRTPQRDLGQWTYNADGAAVIRYQMENTMASRRYGAEDADLFDDGPPGGDAPPPAGEPGGDEMSPEEVEQYQRHKYGHPLAEKYYRHCAKKYAMPEEPADGEAPGDLPGGPTDLPTADAPPMRNSVASATNALPRKMSREASDEMAIRYRRLERDLEAMRAEVRAAREKESLADARARVRQLKAEDYDLDMEEEVAQFARLPESERDAYEQKVRRCYRRAPTGHGYPVASRSASGAAGDPSDPESLPREDVERIDRYRRENRLYDLSYQDLAARAIPEKYGRKREG